MKYIFIGNPMNEIDAKKNQNKIHFSAADNKAQNVLIEGLYERYKEDLLVISVNRNGKQKIGTLPYGAKYIYVNCNDKNKLTYYLSIMTNIYFEYKKILKKYKKEKIVTITWGPSIFYCLGPILNKKTTIFLPFIVTSVEYPEYIGLYKMISNLNIGIVKKADGTITYVEQSALDYTKKPYVLTYYTVTDEQIVLAKKYKQHKKTKKISIGYTGQLTKVNGLDTLLKVIVRLPDEYVLNICGKGPLENDVEKFAKKNPQKINYLGYLSPTDTFRVQLESDILIVIRPIVDNITEYYSKYAASGKLTEYLLTGNPIITNDIPALSKEIKKYLTIIPNCTEEDIIQQILELGDSFVKNNKSKLFALKNFNKAYQNKKICDFIDIISNKDGSENK